MINSNKEIRLKAEQWIGSPAVAFGAEYYTIDGIYFFINIYFKNLWHLICNLPAFSALGLECWQDMRIR